MLDKLKNKLINYADKNQIQSGHIFLTRSRTAISRSSIWKMMKDLGKETGINLQKIYPHNLRHLLAYEFYSVNKDISLLSDILGHSDINTTRIYIKSSGEEHKNDMEKLDLVT